MAQAAATVLLALLLLLQATAPHAAPLDDTHRNDGLSMKDAEVHRSSVYEALKRGPAVKAAQGPPIYFSLTQVLEAPIPRDLVLPACFWAAEVSAALAAGINTAFRPQLTQNASVDTTYVQRVGECSYKSFIAYSGSEQVAKTLVNAGKTNSLCDVIPLYCATLNIIPGFEAKQHGRMPHRSYASGTPEASTSTQDAGIASTDAHTSSTGSGSTAWRRNTAMVRRSAAVRRVTSTYPHVLVASGGSTAPELPPVLHYNCQKHYFWQQRDHFASPSDSTKGPSLDIEDDDEDSSDMPHESESEPYLGDDPELDMEEGEQGEPEDQAGLDDTGGGRKGHKKKRAGKLPHDEPQEQPQEAPQQPQLQSEPTPWIDMPPQEVDKPGEQQPRGHRHGKKRARKPRAGKRTGPKQPLVAAQTQAFPQATQQVEAEATAATLQAQTRPDRPSASQGSRVKFGGGVGPSPVHLPPQQQSTSSAPTNQFAPGSIPPNSQFAPGSIPPNRQFAPGANLGGSQGAQPGLPPGGNPAGVFVPEGIAQRGQQLPMWGPQQQWDPAPFQAPNWQLPEGWADQSAQGPAGSSEQALPGQSGESDMADNERFKQVYWVCDAAWPEQPQQQKTSGNVVVFVGAEGPLGTPGQPIVFENARRLNALVVLVEHRYYGESLPFPAPKDGAVPTYQYQWLTIAQAIEDTTSIVAHIRKERDVPKAVPNIVIGGSYGGMLAAYHRLKRPDVFGAAVAASAPMQYIFDTPMWAETSNQYHQLVQRSVDVMSGGTECSDTIRSGLALLLDAGISAPGRLQLARAFKLCDESLLSSKEAVEELQRSILDQWQGYVQVNNQPPLLGQVSLACEVLLNTTAAGGTALEALSAVSRYFRDSCSNAGCWEWDCNPKTTLVPGAGKPGYHSYVYQCCTEGVVHSGLLPAIASDRTLNPEDLPVHPKDFQAQCRTAFGPGVPALHSPSFARNFMKLLDRKGGVVITDGGLDAWAGGSVGVDLSGDGVVQAQIAGVNQVDIPARDGQSWVKALSTAASSTAVDLEAVDSSYKGAQLGVTFVTYRNASHCTDTHTYAWQTPGEPPAWKQQRADAMDRAAAYAMASRSAILQSEGHLEPPSGASEVV